jgi:phosphopantothenoylcysteine synthetase/decarboxylase
MNKNKWLEPQGKPVLALGVTGSIAAYKAADLTSMLVKAGMDVRVLMTASALHLVGAQTFMTLSQNPVLSDLWAVPDWRPGHIELALCARVLLIAPATANILAKMAQGIADDALSTYYLSHSGAVLVAPAMNPRMWVHPAVQANCQTLRDRGVIFVGPDSGHVACGKDGTGRMADTSSIAAAAQKAMATS